MSSDNKADITGDDNIVGDENVSQTIKADRGSTISDVTQISSKGDVHIGDKIYTRSQTEELNDYLKQAVAAYEARMYQLVARPAAPPDQPYKFLYAFEIEDANIFFGRDTASEEFYQTILKDRLTVLHAKSGAGKTSLLNAGLSPQLIREGRLPVYARAYEDPTVAIKRIIAPPSLGKWPELLPKLSLHEFLGQTCKHLSSQTQELVIILDQFEEFFIFWPERDHRQPFIDALADSYADKSLPVRFIIALRKDYYSDLADFQKRIPTILYNEYRLDMMTRDEAQAAISGPVAKLNRAVSYEQDLLDRLLDDLTRGGMELPHLQIICTRLYELLAKNETIIALNVYEKLGRAEGVLGGYLNSVLDRLPGRGEAIAREVLKELVSSEATKRVLSYDRLKARVESEENELKDVLIRLVNARLLRRDEGEGEIKYEMAHEYLIEEIRKWIDLADLEFKQVEELLAREVVNWRVHGTLIPRDRLELLHKQRERFRNWDNETSECVLRSALQTNFAVEDWARLADKVGEKLFLSVLDDPVENIRLAAIRGLGTLWGLPDVSRLGAENSYERRQAAEALGAVKEPRIVEPLITALRDEEEDVRGNAAKALGKLDNPRAVEPLIAALRDRDHNVRRNAAEALGKLGNPRAVEPLITTLGDRDHNVRNKAAEALGKLGEPAVEPLIAALRDRDDNAREKAAEALGKLGEPAVEPLIAALRDRDDNAREKAAEALGKLGDLRSVEPLIAGLRDESADVRLAIIRSLGTIWGLLEVSRLGDKDKYVRRKAVEALGKLGDSRAVEPLIAALRDRDDNVREKAAEALGKLGDPRSVEPLIAALRDRDDNAREKAAEALGKLGDSRAVEPLIAALQDEDSWVRRNAVEALGKLNDSRAVEPLIAALQDEDSWVRRDAVEALGKLNDPRAVEPLIAALQDRDNNVREKAAGALGELGDPRAVEPLSAVLRDKDNWWVRHVAAEALKKIGTPEALAALKKKWWKWW